MTELSSVVCFPKQEKNEQNRYSADVAGIIISWGKASSNSQWHHAKWHLRIRQCGLWGKFSPILSLNQIIWDWCNFILLEILFRTNEGRTHGVARGCHVPPPHGLKGWRFECDNVARVHIVHWLYFKWWQGRIKWYTIYHSPCANYYRPRYIKLQSSCNM